MSIFRGAGGDSHTMQDRITSVGGAHEQRPAHAGLLGTGTLACNRCDAPIALGGGLVAVTAAVTCPFCSNRATVRDFLSLKEPTRPARVEVRVRIVAPRAAARRP